MVDSVRAIFISLERTIGLVHYPFSRHGWMPGCANSIQFLLGAREKTLPSNAGSHGCAADRTEVNMSIEGVTFCDQCGGVIGRYEIAPVKVDEDGHLVQLHLHNRFEHDCLEQMLIQMTEQYASGALAALSQGSAENTARYDA
jgi:hypothetical protein